MNTVQAPVKTASLGASEKGSAVRSDEKGRLVVVVPDVAEPALLAARIRHVAQVRGQDVLMLGVASQSVSETELRRKLTLVAAFLRDASTRTQFQVLESRDWITALGALLEENDLLACCVAGGLPDGGAGWLDQLGLRYRRTVYAFMDGDGGSHDESGMLRRWAPWIGSVAIIIAFFWLQVRLSQPGDASAYSGWLLVSVAVEIGLVWLLNALLG